MIESSLVNEFSDEGRRIIPVFRKVPKGYVTIDCDESTGTKVIAPKKPKVS